tara:strand:- start:3691 stop:4395 length:705 start_codon:yes stop_codon:yes gene_type:complete
MPIERPDIKRCIDLKSQYKIISLGYLCYSRSFPERFHLYNFKSNEVRMPFDGCNTPYDSMCYLIDTDFVDFQENLNYDAKGNIVNSKLKIIMNHERTKNISSVKVQLNKRKNQFINTIHSCIEDQSTIVFFLQHNDYPEKLINIIRNKYTGLKFKIFVLDLNTYSTIKTTKNTDYAMYINIPQPEGRLVSAAGLVFEKKVLSYFLNLLSEITGIKYDISKIFNNRAARGRVEGQ